MIVPALKEKFKNLIHIFDKTPTKIFKLIWDRLNDIFIETYTTIKDKVKYMQFDS